MGRSGIDKAGRKLVVRLKDAGANAHVVRGDVVDSNSVALAVRACE
jgi:D-arabinose 5-phosphate isomerase GutQ